MKHLRTRTWKLLRTASLLCCLAVVTGCTTLNPKRVAKLQDLDLPQYDRTVLVVVETRTADANLFDWQPDIGKLRKAIGLSLAKTQLFKEVQSEPADYILKSVLRRSGIGVSTEAWSNPQMIVMDWTCKDTQTGETVWKERIKTNHVIPFKHHLSGIVRSVHAQEGAIRDNIEQAFTSLAESGVLKNP